MEYSFDWKENGFCVYDRVTSPYDALSLLQSKRIDAAFVDLRMPEINGFDIINTCRAQKINSEFVIVTGYSDFHYAQRAIKLDAFDYCVKPIQNDEVVNLLPKLAAHLHEKRISEDSRYIHKMVNIDDPSELLSYLTLDINQKYFWVVGTFSGEDISNTICIPRCNTEIHLLMDQHNTIVVYGSDEDISKDLYDAYVSLQTKNILISTTLDNIKKIPSTFRFLYSKLKTSSPDESVGVSFFDINEHLDINKSFLSLLDFVSLNYYQDLSLQELARQYNINYTYCSELFKKVTGNTFSHYITKLRLEKACYLLTNSAMNINDISYKVGYNNYHYFANVFKKNIGITPSQYRKNKKEGGFL